MRKATRMVMIDGYRKGWALRYLREAKAEMAAAQKMPAMAPNLILEAMRKAQVAIYYTLGEPAFIETIVAQTAGKKQAINDPILRCLVEIERTIQELSQAEEVEIAKAIQHGDDMVKMASEIIELFTDEKQDN